MNPRELFCPNMNCPARGQVGKVNIHVHSQKDKRGICEVCGQTFTTTTGTIFYRLHSDPQLVMWVTLPVLLASPDAFVDLASMGFDLYMGDAASFALDAASLAVPGVTGAGALSHADEAYDAFRLVNNFDNTYDTVHYANSLDNVYDTTHYTKSINKASDTAHYSDNIASSSPVYCYNSFSADTTVVTRGGDTPIHEIRIGDYVLAWNELTNEIDWYKVTDTIHHTDETIVRLNIGDEEIITTPEHPFYVERKGWVHAEDLKVGDNIRKANGTAGEVKSIKIEGTSQEMYNLTVDEAHTFFVGDGQWLVHNACRQLDRTLTNDSTGNWLVDAAVQYHRQLPDPRSVTVGVTWVDGYKYVSINGDASPRAIQALKQIVSAENLDLIIGRGRVPFLHAEGALYNKFSYLENLKIGISNSKGPCPGYGGCQLFFEGITQFKDINIYYPAKFWR